MLILMSGVAGCGEFSCATELGRRLPAVVISVDLIEDAMLRAGITRSAESGVAAYEIGVALVPVGVVSSAERDASQPVHTTSES
jgi:predicted kinase